VGDWDVAWFASSSSFSLASHLFFGGWSFSLFDGSSTKIDINHTVPTIVHRQRSREAEQRSFQHSGPASAFIAPPNPTRAAAH